MSQRGFAIELLGAGDYPPTDASADVLVSVDEWNALEEPDAVLCDPICLAFDVSPDRQVAIVAGGLDDRGRQMIEVVAAGAGTGWVAAKLQELYAKWEVVEIVCDGYGPSAAIARRVDELGVTVTRMDSLQFGIACGMFVDAIGEGKLVHLGQDEMLVAIRGAKARPLVDRWAWSRTKSTANISPLVAGTIAHWSAVEQNLGSVAIF